MKRTFAVGYIVVVFALMGGFPVSAQTPAPSAPAVIPAPLPAGPLLNKRAPEFARWTILHKYTGSGKDTPKPTGGESDSTDSFRASPPRILSRTLIKTRNIYHIVTNYENGKLEDRWVVGNVHSVLTPASTELVSGPFASFDGTDLDISSSDFFGFDWITANIYTGIKEVYGHPCLIFQQTQNKYAMEKFPWLETSITYRNAGKVPDVYKEEVPALAAIDVQTRMPVFLQIGNETRSIQYTPVPNQLQQLPPAFIQANAAQTERERGSVFLPSPP